MAHKWPDEPPEDFPDLVKIGRRTVRVRYVSPDHSSVKEEQLLGCAENSRDLITINLGQTEGCMRNTAIHEVIHLAYAHWGVGGSEPDEDEEERIVCWVTDTILALAESGWIEIKF